MVLDDQHVIWCSMPYSGITIRKLSVLAGRVAHVLSDTDVDSDDGDWKYTDLDSEGSKSDEQAQIKVKNFSSWYYISHRRVHVAALLGGGICLAQRKQLPQF